MIDAIYNLTSLTDYASGVKSLKIPKGDNQNPYIEEEQTTQWPKRKSTKGQTTIYKTYT